MPSKKSWSKGRNWYIFLLVFSMIAVGQSFFIINPDRNYTALNEIIEIYEKRFGASKKNIQREMTIERIKELERERTATTTTTTTTTTTEMPKHFLDMDYDLFEQEILSPQNKGGTTKIDMVTIESQDEYYEIDETEPALTLSQPTSSSSMPKGRIPNNSKLYDLRKSLTMKHRALKALENGTKDTPTLDVNLKLDIIGATQGKYITLLGKEEKHHKHTTEKLRLHTKETTEEYDDDEPVDEVECFTETVCPKRDHTRRTSNSTKTKQSEFMTTTVPSLNPSSSYSPYTCGSRKYSKTCPIIESYSSVETTRRLPGKPLKDTTFPTQLTESPPPICDDCVELLNSTSVSTEKNQNVERRTQGSKTSTLAAIRQQETSMPLTFNSCECTSAVSLESRRSTSTSITKRTSLKQIRATFSVGLSIGKYKGKYVNPDVKPRKKSGKMYRSKSIFTNSSVYEKSLMNKKIQQRLENRKKTTRTTRTRKSLKSELRSQVEYMETAEEDAPEFEDYVIKEEFPPTSPSLPLSTKCPCIKELLQNIQSLLSHAKQNAEFENNIGKTQKPIKGKYIIINKNIPKIKSSTGKQINKKIKTQTVGKKPLREFQKDESQNDGLVDAKLNLWKEDILRPLNYPRNLESIARRIYDTALALKTDLDIAEEGLKKVNEEETLVKKGISNLHVIQDECSSILDGLIATKHNSIKKLKDLLEVSKVRDKVEKKINVKVQDIIHSVKPVAIKVIRNK